MVPQRSLQVERLRTRDRGFVVRLRGTIDETLRAEDLGSGLRGAVVFDLDDVHRVTSFGVREWISALRQVEATSYAFINARPSVVAQFNMVGGFAGRGELVSLYLPYHCENCVHTMEVKLDLRHQYDVVVSLRPPETSCELCGGNTEFDDLPQHYLSYVAARPPPTLNATLRALIDGSATDEAERLSVTKEVNGRITAYWLGGKLTSNSHSRRVFDGAEGHVLLEVSGLTAVEPEGFKRMMNAVRQAGAESVRLARLQPPHFAIARDHLETPIVASVLVPIDCRACGTKSTADLDHEALGALADDPEYPLPCNRCRSPSRLPANLPELEIARELIVQTEPEIRAYLRRRSPDYFADSSSDASDISASTVRTGPTARYERLERLGSGGMAEVYLARQRGLEGFRKRVVLKTILPMRSTDSLYVDLFLQEARVAAQISHPNVVQIFDLGRENDSFFIVMEYVDGWDLRAVLRRLQWTDQLMPVGIACRIMAEVCAGLHAAHTARDENGTEFCIVHRDVSPSNIMLGKDGVVKLTDFGVAKVASGYRDTEVGQLKGKVSYASPEQIHSEELVGPPSDVFATGICLYEALTLRNPFRQPTEAATLRAVVAGIFPPVTLLRPELPYALEELIARALATDIGNRFPDANQVRMTLEELMHDLGSPITPVHVAQWLERTMAESTEDQDLIDAQRAALSEVDTDVFVEHDLMRPERSGISVMTGSGTREKRDSDTREKRDSDPTGSGGGGD